VTTKNAATIDAAGRALKFSVQRFSAVWLWALFFIIFSITNPAVFPTVTTVRVVLSGQVAPGILALAVLIPLAAGAFDLSVGTMLAISMVTTAWFEQSAHLNIVVAAVVSIIICAVIGFINGFLVVRIGINSFIATLGVSEILSAAMLFTTQDNEIDNAYSSAFQQFTQHRFLGISLDVYYLIALGLVLWYVLEHTPLGRYLYATGGNLAGARLAGVQVDRMIWGSFIASAAISGFAGVVYASEVGLFNPSFGPPFLFPAFAAVFFGATQIKRRPNVWGTIIALFALAFGVEGFQLRFFGNNYWITPLFNGVALVAAVSLASYTGAATTFRRRRRVRAESVAVPDKADDQTLARNG
jgi:ribose transport system permease protein